MRRGRVHHADDSSGVSNGEGALWRDVDVKASQRTQRRATEEEGVSMLSSIEAESDGRARRGSATLELVAEGAGRPRRKPHLATQPKDGLLHSVLRGVLGCTAVRAAREHRGCGRSRNGVSQRLSGAGQHRQLRAWLWLSLPDGDG